MTNQQAINVMQKYTGDDTISFVVQEAHNMAIAALKKQEPALIQCGKCPICRNWLKEDMAFCDKCGQAVKWRDENEQRRTEHRY